jgi:hypothetical protein
VRPALTRVARPSPRIDSDFLGNHLKPAPSRAVEILYPHMGECGLTAKLDRKNAAYAWLFLARLTRLSTIRFIGQLPARRFDQPSPPAIVFRHRRNVFTRDVDGTVQFQFLHRTASKGPCVESRDGSHTGGSPLPLDLQFPLYESTLYEVFHFWQDIFAHVGPDLKVMVRKFGSLPGPSDQEFGLPGPRDWRRSVSRNPARCLLPAARGTTGWGPSGRSNCRRRG